MNLTLSRAALITALSLATLLGACRHESRDDAKVSGDSAAHAQQPAASRPETARTDTAPRPADTATLPPTPVKTDANVLAHASTLCGTLAAVANQAQGRSKNPDVQQWAQTVMTDYPALMNRIDRISMDMSTEPKAAAADSGEAEVRRTVETLRDIPDEQFDAAFMEQQVRSQRQMIAELTHMQSVAKNPDLRKMLADMIPRVRQHLDQALAVQRRVQGK